MMRSSFPGPFPLYRTLGPRPTATSSSSSSSYDDMAGIGRGRGVGRRMGLAEVVQADRMGHGIDPSYYARVEVRREAREREERLARTELVRRRREEILRRNHLSS